MSIFAKKVKLKIDLKKKVFNAMSTIMQRNA